MARSKSNLLNSFVINPSILQEYSLTVLSTTKVKDVVRLETTEGPKCLKCFDFSEPRLLFVYSAMEHLARQGFKKIAPFIPGRNGNPYIRFRNELFFLTDWLEGRECNFADLEDLKMAAATLAEFHLLAKGTKPLPGSKAKNMLGKWPRKFEHHGEDLLKFKNLALSKKKKSSFDKKFLAHVDTWYQEARQAQEILASSGYFALVQEAVNDKSFTHRDVAGRNFIITPDRQAYMIDFDYARLDIRANDILRLVERSMKKCRWDFALAETVIDCYCRVNPIREEEFTVILAFLCFPQKFWRIANRYYKNKRNWPEKKYLSRLNFFLSQVEQKKSFREKFQQKYCPSLTVT